MEFDETESKIESISPADNGTFRRTNLQSGRAKRRKKKETEMPREGNKHELTAHTHTQKKLGKNSVKASGTPPGTTRDASTGSTVSLTNSTHSILAKL